MYDELFKYAGIERMCVTARVLTDTVGISTDLRAHAPVSRVKTSPRSRDTFTHVLLTDTVDMIVLKRFHGLLKQQGMLIAVLPGDVMYSTNNICVAFRIWFHDLNGDFEEIADGRNVMVRVRSREYEM